MKPLTLHTRSTMSKMPPFRSSQQQELFITAWTFIILIPRGHEQILLSGEHFRDGHNMVATSISTSPTHTFRMLKKSLGFTKKRFPLVSGTIESGSLALGLGARSSLSLFLSQPKSTARESLAAPLMRGQGQTDKAR
jgi:hypothetical protein